MLPRTTLSTVFTGALVHMIDLEGNPRRRSEEELGRLKEGRRKSPYKDALSTQSNLDLLRNVWNAPQNFPPSDQYREAFLLSFHPSWLKAAPMVPSLRTLLGYALGLAEPAPPRILNLGAGVQVLGQKEKHVQHMYLKSDTFRLE